MIKKDDFKNVLVSLGFIQDGTNFFKQFGDSQLIANFKDEKLIYPKELIVNRETITNFRDNENFVVFECVARLLAKGYKPEHIELEKPIHGGHHDVIGYSDISVKDVGGKIFLIIECKTATEFNYYWKRTLTDGSQLFNYFNTYRQAEALCLYSSDYNKDSGLTYTSHIISMLDNDEYLATNKELKSFRQVRESGGNKEEYFEVWAKTYQKEFETIGIFEDEIEAYSVGKLKYTINDLKNVEYDFIQKKYHEFATIMRQHNVGSHENAFDKLVNLFLAKIVDESVNIDELKFRWKGVAHDDYFSFQDRLQKLYTDGMEKFLGEKITYIDQHTVSDAFHFFKSDPDATRDKILSYFRQLKFFTNNDFTFLDVHNEALFYKNAVILKEMVQMLQNMRLKTTEQNQFLGDLFEGFLDRGVKQSEGQYFTPLPIVKFLVSSLPLEDMVNASAEVPFAIDYACGAGHFLTEYAEEIKKLAEKYSSIDTVEYNKRTVGIEKEYRLSKVAKVSAFMYGHDDIRIIYGDALATHADVEDASFSVLVANPPYSVKGFLETLPEEERERFTLSSRVKDIFSNNSIETFFVERAKQLLKSGGVAAIVLPSSILSNGNIYESCREIILKYFYIIAIAQFGSGAFGKTGTNTVTLFLRRRDDNPDAAKHYENRVNSWFNADNSKDTIFDDFSIVKEYCQFRRIDFNEYTSWLKGANIPNAAIFNGYAEFVKKSAEYKRILNKKITKQYSQEMKKSELAKCLDTKFKAIEKDKLYYFMLASDSPYSTVIVKSPEQNVKNFLGYEWSEKKGDEGIKYLGAASNNINEIKTPLFNPLNLDDTEKVNIIIRNNFSGNEVEIPEDLQQYVSVHKLTDLIDFESVTFDKAIKLMSIRPRNERTDVVYYKLSDESLFDIGIGQRVLSSEIIDNGEYPVYSANVFKEFGRIDKLNLEDFSRPSIIWGIDGDWMVNLIEANQPFYPTDHCGIIRIKSEEIAPKYFMIALQVEGEYQRFSRSNRASSQRIKNLSIPLPAIDVQQKIVNVFNGIEAELNEQDDIISKCDQDIKNKFINVFESVKNSEKTWQEVLTIQTGHDYKRVKNANGKYPVYGSGGIIDHADEYICPENTVVIGRKGTINSPIFVKEKFWNIDTAFGLIVNRNILYPEYLFYFCLHFDFNQLNKQTTLPSLMRKDLYKIKMKVPPIELQEEFADFVRESDNKKAAALSKKQSLLKEREQLLNKYFR